MATAKGLFLAVVGSRSWEDRSLLNGFLDRLWKKYNVAVLISGGAAGADTLGQEWAERHKVEVIIHRPNWALHGRGAGYIRNWHIVRMADMVVAFWDEKSRGTLHTLSCAAQVGKPAWVITPDGRHYKWEGEGE